LHNLNTKEIPLETISAYLISDHRCCDDYFAAAEEYAAKQDWAAATASFEQFRSTMTHHFEMEEHVLFPAFEQETGMTQGPTQVMRMEHKQMRELFERMAAAIAAKDADEYAGLSETLLILLQQHNLKEENVLYPMSEQAFGSKGEAVLQQMKEMSTVA
jgi:iron-sulfur cluster repair protein YtfE (RIC family)